MAAFHGVIAFDHDPLSRGRQGQAYGMKGVPTCSAALASSLSAAAFSASLQR